MSEAKQQTTPPAKAFNATVREALKHVDDPAWLGAHSILASPYFLGQRLKDDGERADPLARGRLLQALLQAVAAQLWPGEPPLTRRLFAEMVEAERQGQGNSGPRYHSLLLDLRYFRRYYPRRSPPRTVKEIPEFVGVANSRFFVHLENAVAALGQLLLTESQPALRLERPAVSDLIGRDRLLRSVLADLRRGDTVTLSGSGGVGKTALGAAVAAAWEGQKPFWLTFHPGLNDDLGSLLFALGHFLNRVDPDYQSGLWLHLMAAAGQPGDVEQALGFLRADLHELQAQSLLFCLDEVDLLLDSDNQPTKEAHSQLLEFLEGFKRLARLLLMGQRGVLDTDAHYPLAPLDQSQTSHLLTQQGVALTPAELDAVFQYTNGNPRLLELTAALHLAGDRGPDARPSARAPAVRPLFNRLWKRLDGKERLALGRLAVYRSGAPAYLWQADPAPLASLGRRNLVKVGAAGSVSLLPLLRDLVYGELRVDQRLAWHRDAARQRARLGDYTAAAYHFWQGDQPVFAIQVWFIHRDAEIRRGQAAAATAVFREIPAHNLDDTTARQLAIIQNQLNLLRGHAEAVTPGGPSLQPDDAYSAEIQAQVAEANKLLGQWDAAEAGYDEALATLANLTEQIARVYYQRNQLFTMQADWAAARRSAELARYDMARMRAIIEYTAGHYEPAQAHYEAALAIAAAVGDEDRVARAHHGLLLIAGRRQQIAAAEAHAQKAMAHYEAIGDRLHLEGTRAELAGIYLNVRDFAAVIAPSERALAYFERIKHERWITAICNNLAEAYMETGQLETARGYVDRVLQLENPRALPNALYSLGHIHQRAGRPDHALVAFAGGLEIATRNQDRFLAAYLRRAEGALRWDLGQADAARTLLEAAAAGFADLGLAAEATATRALMTDRPD